MHILTSILPLKCPNKGNEIIHRVPLCDVMFGVFCAMSALRIIGLIFCLRLYFILIYNVF